MSTHPTFLIESCPNTHTVRLAVTLPTLINRECIPEFTKGILITPLEAVINGHSYPFPIKIDPRSTSYSIECNTVLIIKATSALLDPKHTRPSQIIQSNQYWSISNLLFIPYIKSSSVYKCANCSTILIDLNTRPFQTIRLLPSKNWHEMVECWACHEQHIQMPHCGSLDVQDTSMVWVGPCSLVVHMDCMSVNLQWETGTGYGHCKQCSSIVASRPKFSPSKSVHLFKSRIIAAPNSDSAEGWCMSKIRAAMLIGEILDLVNLDGAHRFGVVDLDNQCICLFVGWIINWNCKVRLRSTVAHRAVKLLYQHSDAKVQLNDLPNGMGLIVLPDAQCVFDLVSAVNKDLPISQQTIRIQGDLWNVSYLSA